MFPSFRSLVSALKLMTAAYAGLIFFGFLFWLYFILTLVVFAATLDVKSLALSLLPISILIAGMTFYAIELGAWTLFLKLLWTNPPQFFQVKWSRFFLDFSISVVATLPISLIFTLKVGYRAALKTFWNYQLTSTSYGYGIALRQTVPDLLIQFAWLWFLVAACLIQWQQPKKQ